jgi:hypothetical protein
LSSFSSSSSSSKWNRKPEDEDENDDENESHAAVPVAPVRARQTCLNPTTQYHYRMKFFLACLVYVLIAAVLAWGMLLAIAGKPWLLIAGVVAYLLALGKIGCAAH